MPGRGGPLATDLIARESTGAAAKEYCDGDAQMSRTHVDVRVDRQSAVAKLIVTHVGCEPTSSNRLIRIDSPPGGPGSVSPRCAGRAVGRPVASRQHPKWSQR